MRRMEPFPARYRHTTMTTARHLRARRSTRLPRWALAVVLAASLVTTGCSTDDPAVLPVATGTPTPTPTAVDPGDPDAVDHREIGTFSAPGLRRVKDRSVVELDGVDGAQDWLDRMGAAPETVDEVSEAIRTAAVPDDETLHGLVLHTGCLAPQSWTLTQDGGQLAVRVVPDRKDATIDCVAALTTLAVVAVPNDPGPNDAGPND